jgi:hypothetical protein
MADCSGKACFNRRSRNGGTSFSSEQAYRLYSAIRWDRSDSDLQQDPREVEEGMLAAASINRAAKRRSGSRHTRHDHATHVSPQLPSQWIFFATPC